MYADREVIVESYQQRAIEEHAELQERIIKLQQFIDGEVFPGLGVDETFAIGQQYGHMIGYRAALRKRLKMWGLYDGEENSREQGKESDQRLDRGDLFEARPAPQN